MKKYLCKPLFAAVLMAGPALTGCERMQSAAPPAMPTPEVAVVTIQPQRIVLTTELPGRTSGYRIAEIRPQVTGLIQKRLFIEGADVKAGQVLYEIDPAPFQAALDSASANVEAAKKAADRARAALNAGMANVARQQATVALSKTNRQRFEDLYTDKAVSASDRDQAVTEAQVAEATLRAVEAQLESDRAAVAVAEAAIMQAQAAMETTRINLGYTQITAPISGRIGRSNVTEGAMVTAYQAVLSTVMELDPIYVDVPQSTVELMRLKRTLEGGHVSRSDSNQSTVKLILEDGTAYSLPGTLKFRDVTVDPTTGSVILRIVAPNPEGVLLPGMFVRAVIEEGVDEQAILVSQQAVTRDPKGNPIALVVDADGKVQQRNLKTDRAVGNQWLVSSGLSKGDRVIVEGLQRVRPGAMAKVIPFNSDPGHTAPAATASKLASTPN